MLTECLLLDCLLSCFDTVCTRPVVDFNTLTILGCLVAVRSVEMPHFFMQGCVRVGTAPSEMSADICYSVDGTRTVPSSMSVFVFRVTFFKIYLSFLADQ